MIDIFCIIVLIIFYLIFKIFRLAIVFLDIKINNLNFFLYLLLYRGFSDNSISNNGIIGIHSVDRKRSVYISKYKERGKVGLFVTIDRIMIQDSEMKLLNEFKKRKLNYRFFYKNSKIDIDMELDFKNIESLIKYIWKNIFEMEEVIFDLNISDVCREPGKIIDYNDTSELDKLGINIDIPLTNWDLLLCKLGIKKYSGGCGYPKKNDIITNKKK